MRYVQRGRHYYSVQRIQQTTYCNALRQWAKRETDPNVIGSIYYGCALPEDLEKEVGDILSAAQAQITAIINKLSA